jgi:hypothetical protein
MNPRKTLDELWWKAATPFWNTAEESGAADGAEDTGGDTADGTGDEDSPPPADGGEESGNSSPSTSLLSDGQKADSEEEAGESDGGDSASFTPVTADAIELPEGVELAEEPMNDFLELINNQEMGRDELAQGLINLQVKLAQDAQDAATTAGQQLWDDTQNTWREQAQALPEIGGKALPKTLATIKSGLTAMGADDATFEAFDVTGAGNHPAIIKILHALTKDHVETPPVSGDGAAQKGKLTQAQIMFGRDHK